ncbi:MAG TPA: hypothetical protein VJZ32_09975 [Candidatus Bathyarchaeia archaeon]|nr:hypothetical protein [Candidatus Bathyarchaeia archaeon]
MDVDKFAQEAFSRDSKIRYVGIVDNEHHVLLSKMREGVESVFTSEDRHNYVQIMPLIIVDAAEKLQRVLGNLESVTIRYEKLLFAFFRVKKVIVVLSYNPEVTTPFISASSDLIRMLGTMYLGE